MNLYTRWLTPSSVFFFVRKHFMILTNLKGLIMSKPLNLNLLDTEEFIRMHGCKQVTSPFIYESSSRVFKSDGLFSEDIFGQLNTPQRLITFGYIELNTTVFHPVIYSTLISLKDLYGNILSRKAYAKFDPELKDFVQCGEEDEDADTGYAFFMSNWPKVVLKKNNSISQNEKVQLLSNAGKLAYLSKCLVLPAQIRDINLDTNRLESDSINKLYISLLNYVNAIPAGETSPIYDGIRFSIQKKVAEIYQYIFDMIEKKFGFFQRRYGSRALALGTRNVISPAPLTSKSPDDPTQIKVNEVGVPLFQCLKMAMPLIVYMTKRYFLNDIFGSMSDQVTLIDPDTYNLTYQPVDEDEKTKFTSSEGIEKIVNLFRDREFRFRPLSCISNNKRYYLYLVYDEGSRVTIIRSIQSIKHILDERKEFFNPKLLRPMTYAEFFYLSAYFATVNKHVELCRYPAEKLGNAIPCNVHLLSTIPSRNVTIYLETDTIELPEYPIINQVFADSIQAHACMEPGLGADHDGDTGNLNLIFSKEANEEIDKYDKSIGRWIDTSGRGVAAFLYMEPMPVWNLTRDPE